VKLLNRLPANGPPSVSPATQPALTRACDTDRVCGRYASSRRDVELVSELRPASVVGEELPPSWNLAPTQPARVVLERLVWDEPDAAPDRRLRTLRWGLIPSWAKDVRIGSRLINARKETVTEKPAYQAAASRRRCLVPADGYFEWERRADQPAAVPHFLHRGDQLLTFAGLYELWPDPDLRADDPARWVWSFTILTTRAPDALGHIHDRSPVVIPVDLRGAWLDPALTHPSAVRDLLAAVPEPRFEAHEVSTAVNDHRNNSPQLINPV
jgi:putative SOS response-associated peptidase YedK